jgi:hypothetical protein
MLSDEYKNTVHSWDWCLVQPIYNKSILRPNQSTEIRRHIRATQKQHGCKMEQNDGSKTRKKINKHFIFKIILQHALMT